jgi:WD40 repeat protein
MTLPMNKQHQIFTGTFSRGWIVVLKTIVTLGCLAWVEPCSSMEVIAPELNWSRGAHSSRVNQVVFSPNGRLLASGGGDGLVNLWAVNDGRLMRTLNTEVPQGPQNRILALAFSPDGTRLAGAGHGEIRIWSASNGALIERIEDAHGDWVLSLAYSHDGAVLASGSFDGTAKLWNTANWDLLHTLTHAAQVRAVAFSPDSLTLATGAGAGIHLWQSLTGNFIRSIQSNIGPGQGSASADILSISFSTDGNRLTTGSQDNTIKLWRFSTGERLRAMTGHQHFVYSTAYTHDEKLLVSAGGDSTLRLWDAASGEQVWAYRAETADVTTVACSNSDDIAWGRADGTVLVGRLHPFLMKPIFLPEGAGLHLRFHGELEETYVLQVSTNLTEWSSISTNLLSERPLIFNAGSEETFKFFRVITEAE